MNSNPPEMTYGTQPRFLTSPGLASWLYEQNVSVAFTTYKTGKLFLVGASDSGRISIFERSFHRCMGLYATEQTLHVSTLYQLWKFENALPAGELYLGYDRLYVPRVAYTTGDLDIHDVAVECDGRILFANTAFGCVATVSDKYNFVPHWTPPFNPRIVGEDCCHLNGLALRDGRVRYATALSRSNVKDGWRQHRRDGGVVIDMSDDSIVAEGLSMPHSPRWYRGRLWLHDSGTGRFGFITNARAEFVPLSFCPGYLRGLAFAGDFAVVGLSRPRASSMFSELALDSELRRRQSHAQCGVHVIDLASGTTLHTLVIEDAIDELYDVATLPNVRMPMALGFKTDEIRRVITIGNSDTT